MFGYVRPLRLLDQARAMSELDALPARAQQLAQRGDDEPGEIRGLAVGKGHGNFKGCVLLPEGEAHFLAFTTPCSWWNLVNKPHFLVEIW